MKKKLALLIFTAFIFLFSVNFVSAAGTCECETIEDPIPTIPGVTGKNYRCGLIQSKNKCGQGTIPTCKSKNITSGNRTGRECQSGITCECKNIIPGAPTGTGMGSGDTGPVTIPGYPATGKGILSGNISNLKPGTIVGMALTYIYVIAGLSLFLVLISGGISLMTAAGDPKKIEVGYAKIKDALIGFLIVFVSYLVTQLVEVILGVKIL